MFLICIGGSEGGHGGGGALPIPPQIAMLPQIKYFKILVKA